MFTSACDTHSERAGLPVVRAKTGNLSPDFLVPWFTPTLGADTPGPFRGNITRPRTVAKPWVGKEKTLVRGKDEGQNQGEIGGILNGCRQERVPEGGFRWPWGKASENRSTKTTRWVGGDLGRTGGRFGAVRVAFTVRCQRRNIKHEACQFGRRNSIWLGNNATSDFETEVWENSTPTARRRKFRGDRRRL